MSQIIIYHFNNSPKHQTKSLTKPKHTLHIKLYHNQASKENQVKHLLHQN